MCIRDSDVLARLLGDRALVLLTESGNRLTDDAAQRLEVVDRVGVAHESSAGARSTLAADLRRPRRAPRPEPERAGCALDAHVGEPRALEPRAERVRIHEHH